MKDTKKNEKARRRTNNNVGPLPVAERDGGSASGPGWRARADRDTAPRFGPQYRGRARVRPQTVRYRWKRINDLFGESLHDPEFVIQITMVLKASLPLWKAGDQSNFERDRQDGAATPC